MISNLEFCPHCVRLTVGGPMAKFTPIIVLNTMPAESYACADKIRGGRFAIDHDYFLAMTPHQVRGIVVPDSRQLLVLGMVYGSRYLSNAFAGEMKKKNPSLTVAEFSGEVVRLEENYDLIIDKEQDCAELIVAMWTFVSGRALINR